MSARTLFRRQRGQGLVEAVIVIPVFGMFLLGILQGILLYRAKTTLDYAAFMAARSGATNFADKTAMIDGLARGLMPLYAHEASAGGIATAYAKARADIQLGQSAAITIVSPTKAAFTDWREAQYDGVAAIPNDSLPFRGSAVGTNSHLTVQDANLLKIKVTYQYPLIVPLIDHLIGHLDAARTAVAGHPVYSLDMQAQATELMQTPIRDPNLLLDENTGGTGNDTGGGAGDGSGGDGSGSDPGGDSGGSGDDTGGPPTTPDPGPPPSDPCVSDAGLCCLPF